MATSPLQQAAKAVAIACATSSTFVRIISLNPLKALPTGLFKFRFKEVGIISDAQMEGFRATLIHLLPDALMGDLRKMELSPEIVIRLVVNHVEALLLALDE